MMRPRRFVGNVSRETPRRSERRRARDCKPRCSSICRMRSHNASGLQEPGLLNHAGGVERGFAAGAAEKINVSARYGVDWSACL
jgi:hypothetical protein